MSAFHGAPPVMAPNPQGAFHGESFFGCRRLRRGEEHGNVFQAPFLVPGDSTANDGVELAPFGYLEMGAGIGFAPTGLAQDSALGI